MESSLESTNNKLLGCEAREQKESNGFSNYSLMLIYIFFAALAIRLWFNFCTEHVNSAAASDASEYLRYATALSHRDWSAPAFGPEWKEFVITGPAFPFFLWLCSFATLSQVNCQRLEVFLIAHSVISSVTVALIALIGKNLWNKRVGIVAGSIAIFYPAFIVNSGRLYSETFATFIEVAALAILSLSRKTALGKYQYILLGALLVILQLTRSSMILFSAASLALVFAAGAQGYRLTDIKWRAAFTNLILVLLGFLTVLIPWLCFEKTAFNKLSLVVDRVGHYNLFVGTNTEIQGFLSYPYPDGRGIEEKSFITLAKEAYRKSPNRFIKLMLDKPARLYKFPWNDFRTPIGPCSMQTQVAFHQIVVLLAIIGLIIGLAFSPSGNNFLGKAAVVGAIVINLPFLAFITVPRYNLMAMPAFILLAAAAACALTKIQRENKAAKAPKIASASALFLLIFLRDDFRSPFIIGDSNAASLYFVQGTDILTRSLIATVALIVLLAALWTCLELIAKQSTRARTVGRIFLVLLSILLLPLALFPQRSNGRMREGILTLTRPGEEIKGSIALEPTSNLNANQTEWFLLVDTDLGHLANENFEISLNGLKAEAPPMPSLAALDDWHYIKTQQPGNAYLECTYIFDCLSREAALNNTELRQWFVIPVSQAQRELLEKQKVADITITQRSANPSTLFSAGQHSKGKQVIPSRAIYSWEKAFYGVENDQGLTCPRYDEIVKKRKANWSISYKGQNELLTDLDLNVRLLRVRNCQSPTNQQGASTLPANVRMSEKATLSLEQLKLKEGQLAVISIILSYPQNYSADTQITTKLIESKPVLQLLWRDQNNVEQTMSLPYLTKPQPRFSVCLPLDLRKINGSQFRVTCTYPDKNCQIELGARVLDCHPLFSDQELF